MPTVFRLIIGLLIFGGIGSVLYLQVSPLLAKPCEEPFSYHIATLDAEFGITEAALISALKDAERVWEAAAGRELFVLASEGGIAVQVIYGEEQRAQQLGKVIDSEQGRYDAKKKELEEVKKKFGATKIAYERESETYEKALGEYNAQVAYWNERGGAPPAEYQKLQNLHQELGGLQDSVNQRANTLNTLVASINQNVDELNVLAQKLNAKVAVYNQAAGDEFDQGDYQEDEEGKRINIYEFSDRDNLRRVLVHEFGHALGIGHVENPNSVMYSYNIGSDLELSEEDIAALRAACKIDEN